MNAVALVTGAGSGIGRSIARAFIGEGATVCAVARSEAGLREFVAADRAAARVRAADLTQEDTPKILRAWVEEQFGSLDILVHSVGCIRESRMEAAAIADLDLQYETNLRGPYRLTRELLPLLKSSGGDIVFVNSSAGLSAERADIGQYAAMEHALRAVADSLRQEVNPHGVRVLSLYPGRTATALQQTLHQAAGVDYRPELLLQPEDVANMVLAAIKLPRTAEVTDIRIRSMRKPAAAV